MYSDTTAGQSDPYSAAIAAADRQLQELALRIARLQPGSSKDAEVWDAKATERFHAACLKLIEQCRESVSIATALASSTPKLEQQDQLKQRRQELENLRAEVRTAWQARTQHTAELWDREKADLMSGAQGTETTNAPLTGTSAFMTNSSSSNSRSEVNESQAVTSSLTRSRQMMADQVARMAAVAQLVGEQDQLLRDTADEHRGVGGSANRAGRSLTRLKSKELVDLLLMSGSTAMFFAAAAYVIWARIPSFGLF